MHAVPTGAQNPLGLSVVTFSIVGLYSLVVLTVGRFVRLQFANLMVLIPFEDLHDVDPIMRICEGIYIARHFSSCLSVSACRCALFASASPRYMGQHLSEERLYRRLIKIYRTPPLLRRLTKRKDE